MHIPFITSWKLHESFTQKSHESFTPKSSFALRKSAIRLLTSTESWFLDMFVSCTWARFFKTTEGQRIKDYNLKICDINEVVWTTSREYGGKMSRQKYCNGKYSRNKSKTRVYA